MNSKATIQNAIDHYILSIVSNAPDMAPLAAECVYSGPLVPDPILGEQRIRQFLGEIAPFITRIKQMRTIIDDNGAAIVVEIENINGRVIPGAWFFEFEYGLINSVQVYFDSRLLMRDMG